MNFARALFIATLLAHCVAVAFGYDFAERPSAVILDPPPTEFAFAGAGFAQSTFRANEFQSSPTDTFQVEIYAHHAALEAPRTRLGVFYASYLLNGPITSGSALAATAAQWWMNAVQFEYGLVGAYHTRLSAWDRLASLDLPAAVSPVLLLEYSRRSYHRLHDGLSNPAADIVRGGVGWVGLQPGRGPVRLDAMVRVGWSELYEFWGALFIPPPRALYTWNIALEATVGTPWPSVEFFALALPDIIVLRRGGLATDTALQGGLRLGRGAARIELFLDFFHSEDTEQLVNRAAPATLFGYGVRFTLGGARR